MSANATTVCSAAPPQFQIQYRNQTAQRGEDAVLECEADGETPVGIVWKKDALTLQPDQEVRYPTARQGSQVPNSQTRKSGTYQPDQEVRHLSATTGSQVPYSKTRKSGIHCQTKKSSIPQRPESRVPYSHTRKLDTLQPYQEVRYPTAIPGSQVPFSLTKKSSTLQPDQEVGYPYSQT